MDALALQKLSVELCCAMRLVHHRGAGSPFIAGHASVKLDGGHLLVNRFGASFATVAPEDLLVIDSAGTIVEGRGRVNQTIILHCHIHERCSDVVAAFHSHPDATVTLGTLARVPQIFDQESCVLAGGVSLLQRPHQGLDTSPAVADAFRDNPQTLAIMAPNHGAFTRGPSIEMAAYLMILLEHACRRHLDVVAAGRASGIAPQAISDEDALAIRAEQRALKGMPLLWEDAMQSLRRIDPELLALRDGHRAR